jgi:hypothetical protein
MALAEKPNKLTDRERRAAGQVQHDSRGNAVWQWAADTARTAMASTSQLLKKLDLSGLSLESDEREEPRPRARVRSVKPAPKPVSAPKTAQGEDKPALTLDTRKPKVGGFDPYSSDAGVIKKKPPAGSANRRAAAPRPRRASWWQRLLGRG